MKSFILASLLAVASINCFADSQVEGWGVQESYGKTGCDFDYASAEAQAQFHAQSQCDQIGNIFKAQRISGWMLDSQGPINNGGSYGYTCGARAHATFECLTGKKGN